MKKIGRKLADLETLEGGGAGGSGGGRSGGGGKTGNRDWLTDIRISPAEERARMLQRETAREKARQDGLAKELSERASKPKSTTFKRAEDKYAKGGYVSAADGCAKKGKTKGRMV